jgi:RimJ/RimL family protein N-acetyltransferase
MLAAGCHEEQAPEPGKSAPATALLYGTEVRVRPVQQSDVALIQEMHLRLSNESVYYRYLAPHAPTAEDLQRLCFLDGGAGAAIVATVEGPQEKVIAMACYCVDPGDPTTAEPAILVEDSYQGRGLGRRMFRALCRQAKQCGVDTFQCFAHPANHRVLRLIKGCGLHCESRHNEGVIETCVWLEWQRTKPAYDWRQLGQTKRLGQTVLAPC